MVGANPARTSWVDHEVPGLLKPIWYKKFESYISHKNQITTGMDTLFIATANGLYAIDHQTGDEKWIYPTSLPLGHAATFFRGSVYVGGFDRMLHAIDAETGTRRWTVATGMAYAPLGDH
jgi:outer membrane protein assembly factor BamB